MTRQVAKYWTLAGTSIMLAFTSTPAPASVVLLGTRVIYSADARDATIAAENKGDTPVLVQTWLDDGDSRSTPEDSKAPYLLNPPLFRLDPGHTQSLRLIHTQSSLPQDRESLHWLNVLSIPPETTDAPHDRNVLRLLMRSRIKVFYRPKGLAGKAEDAAALVQWSYTTNEAGKPVLRAKNPTAYHVTFIGLRADVDGQPHDVVVKDMVAPGGTMDVPLTGAPATGRTTKVVGFSFINDQGGVVEGQISNRRD